ncbi:hypothetical protein CBG60_04020 [Fusobacterium animalis]|uniref:CRISPR-associated protein Csh1 n=1 Tax=Fusobacterium animalis 7_1 TaxID=457405 RepID=A0A140PVK4_9FUSO|nr:MULTISPECIES: hypothetical protein [Fusobacterium]ASG30476.1 hypothetical protein CBG60_04020 [Fusobacterium animalis]EEO43825.1 hypothetical protein FSDG_02384 [Fusobacterium animalis 7_1]EPC07703.1 hypothetical protein HMPREF9369_02515 [Fusobacterium polymorphum F0401]ERT39866.1 hypothetical protein HMPREF1538_02320 [Fusobacterium nucleatum CTI-1]BEO90776.1 hypothetical protein FNCA3_21040 [Fusobacterium nucleatum]
MIDEALEVFKKIYDKEGEELVVSKHIPKDGTYILVNIKSGKIIEKLNIFYDKKSKKIDGELNQYYGYFRAFDYYSNLVDMNKPMDPKKTIHSNQIYSFFIKKDSIRENKLTKSIIEGYKKNLLNPEEKYNSKEGKELYKNIAEKLPKIEKDIVEDIFLWIEDNVNENLLENDNKKDYLKIFFVEEDLDKSLEVFKNEHKRYIIPNIFNSNDYNKKIGETIYGLSNNNMGLNAKKVFLENKTRRVSSPYLVDTDEILLQYAFYNYLLPEVKQGNYYIYFSENEITPRTYKEGCPNGAKYLLNASYSKDVDIKNFSVISKNSSEEININFKEILHQKKKDTDEIEYGNLNREKMMNNINKILFYNSLLGNFLLNDGDLDIKDIEVKKLLMKYRNSFYKWFYLNDEAEVKKNIRKIYLDAVMVAIGNGHFFKASQQLDFGFCLEKYFYGKSELMEEIMNVKEVFLNHTLSEEDWEFSNDEEYFFAVGQILAYINYMRNSKAKSLNFIKQLTFVKNIDVLKEKIKKIIISYSHIFETKNKKINRTISNISLYQPKEIRIDMLLAGFTADIIFFKKREEK